MTPPVAAVAQQATSGRRGRRQRSPSDGVPSYRLIVVAHDQLLGWSFHVPRDSGDVSTPDRATERVALVVRTVVVEVHGLASTHATARRTSSKYLQSVIQEDYDTLIVFTWARGDAFHTRTVPSRALVAA